MKTIRIDTECNAYDLYPDVWKDYIYSPSEEFDEVFAIFGNKDFHGVKNASWYKAAIDYLRENEIKESETEIFNALTKLFPEKNFDIFSIYGCTQGEYQSVICDTDAIENYCRDDIRDCLSDFYFGYVTEIMDDNCSIYIADSEMWEYRNDRERFIDDIRDYFGIQDDEEIELLISDGYSMVKNWATI